MFVNENVWINSLSVISGSGEENISSRQETAFNKELWKNFNFTGQSWWSQLVFIFIYSHETQ